MCVCVNERERERERERGNACIQKTRKLYINKNDQLTMQRGIEGAYVVTYSLYSLITIASWERGGDLTTYYVS